MINSGSKRLRLFLFLTCVLGAGTVQAFEPWTVRNFRVEGAQRISEGTIYNYLPINIGDTLTDQRIQEAIRAMYSTGFFRDVEFRRDGDVLLIAVLERPSIDDFTISGNKDIETEQLESSLRDVGLSRGSVFDRSVLEEVKQALTEQYYSQGKYGVSIETPIEELPDNRVRVAIEIIEGDRAKIRQVNVVGNTTYDDEEILDNFELQTGNLLSFIRNDDRYSKQALEGDLETLRSFYMDRGFADFRWDGVQVAISPDKRDIFITVNITEGDRYTISDVKLAGQMVVPEAELRARILTGPGQIYSQGLLTASEEFMRQRLGTDGYAFAQVQAVPELDRETKEASVTFFIDPQNRVYVRRINFNGADSVNDEVFRREMRQLEGSYLSNTLVDRSRIRIQRLPYVQSVDYETNPVLGSPDLVDIDFEIEEGQPGSISGGIGYSQTYGAQLNANFVHANFMGTGSRIGVNVSGGEFAKVANINFTDPYRTINELSRTLSVSFRDITQFTSASSAFDTQTFTLGADWSYPITEVQYLRFGFAVQRAELLTSQFSSLQALEWVTQNGEQFDVPGQLFPGTAVRSFDLNTGWIYDSRNRVLFPDRGTRIGLNFTAAIPGSEVQYYVAALDFTKYVPLWGRWIFKVNSEIAFGDAYGETTALPPYRNFFAGGPGTVRGFKESRLGPRDTFNNPYGGNMKVATQFELIIPLPEKLSGSTRAAMFFDIGNVFTTGGVTFFDQLGDVTDYYDYTPGSLKRSVGVAVEWLAPMGLLRFSYALPLNASEATDRFLADETEEFQFTIGSAF
ncbi:MAG: outer membrane protein assembly factor BamA [Gammaproteobacteria bacterium]